MTARTWAAAFGVALLVGALFVVQALLFARVEGADFDLPLLLVEKLLPWLAWALLAPLLLALFRRAPIERGRALRGVLLHVATGPFVAALKLLVTSPAAALLIWGPAGVSYGEGLRWLSVNRTAENVVIYWLLVAAYAAVAFAREGRGSAAAAGSPPAPPDGIDSGLVPLHTAGRVVLVEPEAIAWVEADGNYLDVHVEGVTHRVRGPLTAFEAPLPAGRFLRIHRSRLVNVRRIREIHPWFHGDFEVVLADGTRLVTGRTYRGDVRRLVEGARA